MPKDSATGLFRVATAIRALKNSFWSASTSAGSREHISLLPEEVLDLSTCTSARFWECVNTAITSWQNSNSFRQTRTIGGNPQKSPGVSLGVIALLTVPDGPGPTE